MGDIPPGMRAMKEHPSSRLLQEERFWAWEKEERHTIVKWRADEKVTSTAYGYVGQGLWSHLESRCTPTAIPKSTRWNTGLTQPTTLQIKQTETKEVLRLVHEAPASSQRQLKQEFEISFSLSRVRRPIHPLTIFLDKNRYEDVKFREQELKYKCISVDKINFPWDCSTGA